MRLNVDDILVAGQHHAQHLQCPGQCMWKAVRSDGDSRECELRFESTEVTWLVMIYKNGWPVFGQRFVLREHAIHWAETEYEAFQDGSRL